LGTGELLKKIDRIYRNVLYIGIISIAFASLACQSNNPAKANIKALTAELEKDPKNTEALYKRGNAYFEIKDYRNAIADYDMAIKINPDSTKFYLSKGSAYIEMGEYDNAIEIFNFILETKKFDRSFFLLYERRGFAYYKKGLYETALEDYNRSLKIEPNYYITVRNKKMAENNLAKH
jgi:tetratricopeptide (TPR) repeat protein